MMTILFRIYNYTSLSTHLFPRVKCMSVCRYMTKDGFTLSIQGYATRHNENLSDW